MPVYKEEKRNTWFCKCNYKDWLGESKSKMKRGFATKKDAQQWERDFLHKQSASMDMKFASFVEVYFEDKAPRLKERSIMTKRTLFETKIIPYFGEKQMNEITAVDIIKWQKALMKMFNLINIGERAGSGVPNIFNVWEDEGWEEPVIEERFDPDRTVLTLSFVKKNNKRMSEDANLIQKNERSLKEVLKEVLSQKDFEKTLPIIDYLETNASITTQTVKQITGKSSATAWRYIQILVKADVLESDGNTNNAEYVLKDICNRG